MAHAGRFGLPVALGDRDPDAVKPTQQLRCDGGGTRDREPAAPQPQSLLECSEDEQIAEILAISRSSVDSYVQRLFAKLGVSDWISASVRGLALGLDGFSAVGTFLMQRDERLRPQVQW